MKKSLFFLFFVTFACSTPKATQESIEENSSWEGGFLLKYRSYQFGKLNYQSKSDPLFQTPQVKQRIEKELRFNLDQKNLSFQSSASDAQFYYYFIGNDLTAPVLPYQTSSNVTDSFAIKVDTLTAKQHLIVIDLVDTGTQTLVWRTYSKIGTYNSEVLFREIPLVIQVLLRKYPG